MDHQTNPLGFDGHPLQASFSFSANSSGRMNTCQWPAT